MTGNTAIRSDGRVANLFSTWAAVLYFLYFFILCYFFFFFDKEADSKFQSTYNF